MSNKVIIIGVVVIILVGAVVLFGDFFEQDQTEEEVLTEQQKEIEEVKNNELDAQAGVLFVSGPVVSVNTQERSFILEANDDNRAVTVIVGQDVPISKVEGLNLVEASFSDIKQGNSISVKSESMIQGRTEITDVVSLDIFN